MTSVAPFRPLDGDVREREPCPRRARAALVASCSTRKRRWAWAASTSAALVVAAIVAAAVILTRPVPRVTARLTIDLSQPSGGAPYGFSHGFNRAPVCDSGASIAGFLPPLGASIIRTHDQRALDWWVIFPDPLRDPDDPSAYNFTAGDALFAAILAAGQAPYIRLGVSWPPGPPAVPAWSLRPAPALFARISVRMVQHYNDAAWVGGFSGKRVAAWEVWNEPDGTNPVMWGGSPLEFYALYNATAAALKAYDPSLRVGGPGVARASSADYAYGFVDFVVRSGAPLDFFSWHFYGSGATRATGMAETAAGVRAYLDTAGLANVSQHVTEWNTDATPSHTDRDSAAAAAFVAITQTLAVQGGVSVSLFYPACAGIGQSSWGIFQDAGDGRTVTSRLETRAYGWVGDLLARTPAPLVVLGSAGPEASALAGSSRGDSLGGGGGGLNASNVSVVYATQYWRCSRLDLTFTGIPSAAYGGVQPWHAVAELIDGGGHDGRVAVADVAVQGETVSISVPFASPAVVRVRLQPPSGAAVPS
jgi:hypothetical protein